MLAGVATTVLLVAKPAQSLMFNDRDGSGKLVDLLGGATLQASLPTLLWEDWLRQWPGLALVAGVVAVAAAATWLASRHGGSATSGVCAAIVGAVVGGTVTARAV